VISLDNVHIQQFTHAQTGEWLSSTRWYTCP